MAMLRVPFPEGWNLPAHSTHSYSQTLYPEQSVLVNLDCHSPCGKITMETHFLVCLWASFYKGLTEVGQAIPREDSTLPRCVGVLDWRQGRTMGGTLTVSLCPDCLGLTLLTGLPWWTEPLNPAEQPQSSLGGFCQVFYHRGERSI